MGRVGHNPQHDPKTQVMLSAGHAAGAYTCNCVPCALILPHLVHPPCAHQPTYYTGGHTTIPIHPPPTTNHLSTYVNTTHALVACIPWCCQRAGLRRTAACSAPTTAGGSAGRARRWPYHRRWTPGPRTRHVATPGHVPPASPSCRRCACCGQNGLHCMLLVNDNACCKGLSG